MLLVCSYQVQGLHLVSRDTLKAGSPFTKRCLDSAFPVVCNVINSHYCSMFAHTASRHLMTCLLDDSVRVRRRRLIG